jgi:hypothetical protein
VNIILLKNIYEFKNLSREKLFGAHFVGHWNTDGTLTICKDRFYGRVGVQIYEKELVEYIERFSVDNPQRVTQTEINEKYPTFLPNFQ